MTDARSQPNIVERLRSEHATETMLEAATHIEQLEFEISDSDAQIDRLRAKVDEQRAFYDRALTAEAALQEAYADHRKQKAHINELEKMLREAGK